MAILPILLFFTCQYLTVFFLDGLVNWKKKKSESLSVVSDSLQHHGLYSPWSSQGQNTGVGSISLLQGIFLTQGSNPGLPHCRQILYQLSHKGSTLPPPKKRNAHHKSIKFQFYLRPYWMLYPGAGLSDSSEELLSSGKWGARIHMTLGLGNTCRQAYI